MNRFLLRAASFVSLTIAAQAADLPVRAAPPVVAPVPAFTWTGFYIGVNASGLVDGTFNASTLPPLPAARANISASGFVAGGTVGYNYQFTPGSGFVVGVEGDAGYSDIKNRLQVNIPAIGAASIGVQTDSYFATIRGRVGYAWGPLLAYATGGWAFTDIGVRASANLPIVALGGTIGRSTQFDGYTVGGGLEYAILPNVSVKAEYLYSDFKKPFTFQIANLNARVRAGLETHQLKVGINYRFNMF
ncbi:MAG: outer membrane beta-barrel protein [Methylobacterium sp.]|uniref:outer membrane protein n=1 Tax=Methylobacterium sp. TaxID=409 RepID=UPI002582DFE8|nr:outer membrane beta-barrel protein [Methylobacterium sp.]MBY0299849.1 outer membrane beta-barrel protein [Methylobacterium sp.]